LETPAIGSTVSEQAGPKRKKKFCASVPFGGMAKRYEPYNSLGSFLNSAEGIRKVCTCKVIDGINGKTFFL
jgi:hypothetical protein